MNKAVKPFCKGKVTRRLCLMLAALLIAAGLPVSRLTAHAASLPTSLGLAQHGINAYNEGWQYSFGGKGETVNGVRVSDCAGLIYAYFSDLGVGGCMGGATAQATQNCILTGTVDQGLPRIHGLALTIMETDDINDGFSHIGIYIGNNESCENSDYGTNMVRGSIFRRSWTTWHLFDNGVKYPDNGWYEFDGKMVHYTNYEYDVDTRIDGFTIGSDGFAQLDDGTPVAVIPDLLSDTYVDASVVKDWLETNGWNAPSDPSEEQPEDYNGIVSANSVNLRSQPGTDSSVVAMLHHGTKLQLGEAVEGGLVEVNGKSSTLWYPVTTMNGRTGYISALLVEISIPTPVFSCDGKSVTISAGSADIYYTTDGSDPDESSALYFAPVYTLSSTYKAIAVKDGVTSSVATATVLGNGAIYNDFAFGKDWYAETVDKAVSQGLFESSANKQFNANGIINRAQFVQVLANLSGEDISLYDFEDMPAFSDVPENAYYYHALAWAVSNNVVTYSTKGFKPNDSISREQMCTMLDRFATQFNYNMTWDGDSTIFADDEKISDWAKEAVYIMRNLGIVNGVGENKFNPQGTATRAAACTMVINFKERVVDRSDQYEVNGWGNGANLEFADEITEFTDIDRFEDME